jgi:glycosyltransferase involved in cell wall biosynthesis
MKRLKILFVLPAYYPALDYGGPIPVAQDLAQRLTARGHEVTVLTTNLLTRNSKLGNKTEEREVEGIRTVYLNSVARYHWVGITPDIFRYLRRELDRFDVVHVYGYREFINLAVARWARAVGKPYVLQALGTTTRMKRSLGKKLVYDTLFGSSILKNTAALIAKSEVERQQYEAVGIPPERVALVPNGMEIPEEARRVVPGNFRKAYGIGDSEILLLFLGRIDPIKGLDLLIKTFARVKGARVRLAIVGPDEGLQGEFERLARERGVGDSVVFTGGLYGAQKWEAYTDADVYVLPSVFENFPRTVLEAMVCGTPVVITDRCGIASQVRDRAGIVVPYEEGALAGALQRLLDDRKLREKLGEGGRRVLEEEFSWEPVVEKVEALYGRALASGRGMRARA